MNTQTVTTTRIQYTPSPFARTSLLHLSEVGTLTALRPHTSARENLGGYLIFVVEHGSGVVEVSRRQYEMKPGDVAFIDCSKAYSHSTPAIPSNHATTKQSYKETEEKIGGVDNGGEGLWTISWVHFNGMSMAAIYSKFQERSGRKPVFHAADTAVYTKLLKTLYSTASSSSYIRDMRINTILSGLLEHIMADCWSGEVERGRSTSVVDLEPIKRYLDEHYDQQITLESLSKRFFVEKSYLSRTFKSAYGINLFDYLNIVRINKVKELLRFGSDGRELKLAEIAEITGFSSESYLSMRFKKMEGCSPKEYRMKWK